jgi:hypothetical protein
MSLRRKESTQEVFVNKNSRCTVVALLCSVLLIIGAIAIVPPAWGQQASGTITGSVTDPSGSAVTTATVTARDVDRGTIMTTQTNNSGAYTFPQVTVGNIEVTVEASGFSKAVHPVFTLILNQIARLDFQLTVGNVSQTVEVTAAPPLLQTDSTEIGTLVDSNTTVALPLSTRNVNQLVLLTPGVVSPNIFAFQAPQATFGTGRPYVNGAREQDNNFSLDGMDEPGRQQRSRLCARRGRGGGVQRHRGKCPSGFRQLHRRRGRGDSEVWHQPIPRRHFRIPAQYRSERQHLAEQGYFAI